MSLVVEHPSSPGAVVLMAYGGPAGLDEVEPFLGRVLAPREPPAAMIERARERYRAIGGGSPLVANTLRQAEALGARLRASGHGDVAVLVGMRFSEPSLGEALRRALVHAGGGTVVAVVMASHQSAGATGAYRAQVDALRAEWSAAGTDPPGEVVFAEGWQRSAGYLRAVAECVAEARDRVVASAGGPDPWLLFTAHSLPVDPRTGDPVYESALAETAAAVAERAGAAYWRLGYQSRSDRPGASWLGPDAASVLVEEAASSRGPVVVVPLGFVAEHLETLYDLDIALRAQADMLDLPMERARTVQTHPAFIEGLAGVVAALLDGRAGEPVAGGPAEPLARRGA